MLDKQFISNMKKYILWHDMLLFYGSLPRQIHLHQHPVIQLIIAVDGVFLKKSEKDEWEPYKTLLVAPNIAHECDASAKKIFSLNIDPESSIGNHILQSKMKDNKFCILHNEELAYFDFNTIEKQIENEEFDQLYHLIQSFFYRDDPETKVVKILDERIRKVKKYIRENIHNKFETTELCELVFLSESRLLHLFKEQMGLPIRNYILWIRLKVAIDLIFNGHNLTYAAHEAGFSDSSHMSKTFVKSLGLNPAELLKNSKFIQVCEMIEA